MNERLKYKKTERIDFKSEAGNEKWHKSAKKRMSESEKNKEGQQRRREGARGGGNDTGNQHEGRKSSVAMKIHGHRGLQTPR